ncbi:MAG: hypothetical protein HYX90_01790 [Chloroflexi bacterium]|nr:hypothetical protein [Chloroflexota bacterium]
MTKSRLIRLGFMLYFLGLGSSFMLLRNAPTLGYELSIYEHTPVLVIAFLMASTAAGIALVAGCAFSSRQSKWWTAGLGMLAMNTFIVLGLPYFRGYYAYAHADPAAHWAWIEEMLTTHRIPPGNIYPALHIGILNVSLLATISPRVLVALFPGLLSILWMLYIYLLATVLFSDRRYAILAAGASSVFLFLTYQVPIIAQTIGHYSMPLVFYLYFMSKSRVGPMYRFLLLGVLVGMPFTHPMPVMVLIATLVALEFVLAIFRRWRPAGADGYLLVGGHFELTAPMITSLVFFLWISTTRMFTSQLRYTYLVFSGDYTPTAVSELGATNQLTSLEFFNWALRSFGHLLVFLVLAAIGVAFLVARRNRPEFAYALAFLAAAFLGFFGQTMLDIAVIGREALYYRTILLNQLVNVSPIMVSLGLLLLLPRLKLNSFLKVGATTAVIGLAWTVSFFALFPSPWTYQRSIQISRQDVASQRWLFAQERMGYLYTGLNVPHQITFYAFNEFTAPEADEYVQRSASELIRGPHQYQSIPPHFGREQGRRWGEIVPFDLSFVLSDRFTKALTHPVLSRTWVGFLERRDFTQADLDALELDSTADRLYSNGATSIFLVRMTRG